MINHFGIEFAKNSKLWIIKTRVNNVENILVRQILHPELRYSLQNKSENIWNVKIIGSLNPIYVISHRLWRNVSKSIIVKKKEKEKKKKTYYSYISIRISLLTLNARGCVHIGSRYRLISLIIDAEGKQQYNLNRVVNYSPLWREFDSVRYPSLLIRATFLYEPANFRDAPRIEIYASAWVDVK